jgi:hypothetical protein
VANRQPANLDDRTDLPSKLELLPEQVLVQSYRLAAVLELEDAVAVNVQEAG